MATDLSLHFAHLGQLMDLSKEGPASLDWEDKDKVSITLAALMTASDLGAVTKPWAFQRKESTKVVAIYLFLDIYINQLFQIAGLVAEEFWHQGDLEKAALAAPVVPMMDRELRHELPRLQVGFCDGVCLPVYRALACLSPALQPMTDAVMFNREKWAELGENNREAEEEPETRVTRNL